MNRRLASIIVLFFLLCSLSVAGTNGILEGVVKDRTNGEPLPLVNVLIVGLPQGASSDEAGHFEIQNIRAGRYDVRFTLIGYKILVIKNMIILPDLRTRLHVQLEESGVELEEIVVVQEKSLIQKDVTGTTFMVSGDEIHLLPVDNVAEVITLKAGVTAEGNIRGGKTTEVLYLVDGLPVQDVLSGGRSAGLPNSSIVGASVYTGGFEAEYGNALSGVVNIVTKTGTNDHGFFVRADKDNLFGGTQVSKTNEVEVSASGPVEGDRLYYFGAVNGLFTDTRWWQDFQHYFKSPIDKTVNGFGKIDYLFSPTIRLGAQVLFSHRDWHDYQFDWRFNLDGLPPEKRDSYRLAVIISHSVSPTFFYTTSLSRLFLQSRIGGGSRNSVPADDPYQYDFFLRYIVDGQRAWWSLTNQESYTGKFDGTLKADEHHLLKFGGELTLYSIDAEIVKYEPRKNYFGKPLVNEPQLDFGTAYSYHPKAGAIYVQDKIDMPAEGILLSAGLRYDFLDPTATRPAIEDIPVNDTAFAKVARKEVRANLKHQLSPRFGAAMQIAENGYLFVNLGWYFQYPLFEYLYSGIDRAALARGISALTGNPDLEPERTKSYEISIKYSFDHNIVGSVTYFRKETRNQIDAKTFVEGDSKRAGTFGFAEFVNNPLAEADGLELIVSRERGEWVTGELSYTLMKAEGTSGSAYDGFYLAQYGFPPVVRVYPLSWDQRHTVKATATMNTPWDMKLNFVLQFHSGRPYTRYPTSTGFVPVDTSLVFVQNNERMSKNLSVDFKAQKFFRFDWWPNSSLTLYVDVRNLLNRKNVRWVDSNGRIGGELGDPSGYFIGRRTSAGVQVEF